MFHFVLWKWMQPGFREIYTAQHVTIMQSMLARNIKETEYDITVITDQGAGINSGARVYPLWNDHETIANATGRHLPSCYRRLKLFDYETQLALGFKDGDWIVSIDLDTVVIGELDPLLKEIARRDQKFVGWGVPGTYHRMVFNGSFWAFKVGPHLQHVWSDFNPQTSPRSTIANGFLGSDQSWLSMQFSKRNDVHPIQYPKFASYPREVRRTGRLNSSTCIVFFHGSRKPWHPMEQRAMPWINNHWKEDL